MRNITKRSTVYIDTELHRALRVKAAETDRSISELINEAVRNSLLEDSVDLSAFRERKDEPIFSFEEVLKQLKKNGKI
ncbi:MAG: ribbon-helix-helix protein, CopG family [Candidatus Aminicenantes bacterium]|nr:ribbon-helix-helix protein, CopG family [Candidatus Aminicenantes bacterium]